MTETVRPLSSRPLRIALWSLAILAIVLVTLVSIARLAANTNWARDYVETRIEALDIQGQNVKVSGLKGDLLSSISIAEMSINDEQGAWLTASNISVKWNYRSLFARTLNIELMQAQTITVLREPALTPPPPSSPQANSSFLKAYNIASVRVPTLTVSEGVLPQDVTANIQGRFTKTSKLLAAQLELNSAPSQTDTLKLSLNWPANGTPSGDYTINGRSGGLLTKLARLSDAQSIEGQGQFGMRDNGELYGNADLSIDGKTALQAELTEALENISLQANFVPSTHPLSRPYADYLKDDLALELTMTRLAPLETVNATLRSGDNQVKLVARGEKQYRLKANLIEPHRLLIGQTATLDQFGLVGTISLDGPPTFDGNIELKTIESQTVTLNRVAGPIAIKRDGPIVSTDLDLSMSGISVDDQSRVPRNIRVKSVMDYDMQNASVSLQNLRATGKGITLTSKGRLSTAAPLEAKLNGTIKAQGGALGVSQLEQISSNYAIELSPSGLISVDVSGKLLADQRISFFEQSALFKGRMTRSASGQVDVPNFILSQGKRKLVMRGALTPNGRITANVEGTIPNIQIGDIASINTAADLKLDLNNNVLSGDGYLSSDRISAAGQVLDDVRIDLRNARQTNAATSVTLDARASYMSKPLAVTTDINGSIAGNDVSFEQLRASWGDLTVDGSAQIPFSNLELMTVNLTTSGTPESLNYLGQANLTLQIANQRISGSAELGDITLGNIRDGDIEAVFEGDFEQIDLQTKLNSNILLQDMPVPLAFAGPVSILNVLNSDRAFEINGGGNFGTMEIDFVRPAKVSLSPDWGLLADASLMLADGEISLKLNAAEKDRLILEAKNLKLAPLLQLAGQLPRAGAADFALRLDTASDGFLFGQGQLTLAGLRGIEGKVSDFSLETKIEVQPSTTKITLSETGLEELVFNASSNLPISIDAKTLNVTYDDLRGVDYSITSRGQIGPVLDLFLPASSALDGQIDIALKGRTAQSDQTFSGDIVVQNGEFEQIDIGLRLVDINLDAELNSETINLKRFNATGASGGSVSGGGQFQIANLTTSTSQIKVDRLVIFDRVEGRAVTSGTLTLGSDGTRPMLTGQLAVNEAFIDLDNLPQSGPPTLDVTFKEDLETSEDDQGGGILGVDVGIKSDRGIQISGRGVNATMGLDIKIQDDLVAPTITGKARIVRGIFELLGKRFEITPSVLDIAEPISDSELNLEATREADGYTYSVNVSGTIARPEIALSAQPELPEDEVLSRVLFGRSPSQLSAIEAARLAAALAQLSGGGGFDLLGGLEAQLGLDRLTIDPDANGATSLTTGKYLSDDVYVEVRTGATGAPGLSIEWQALDNLEVEAETVPDEGQTLSVKWKRDFD